MDLVEALFSTSSFEGRWCMKVWNIRTGSSICEYCGDNGSQGRHILVAGNGCLLEAHENTARINVWPLNKYNHDIKSKMIAPGRISGFCATRDQKLFAFAVKEKIYFYQTENSNLKIIKSSHFQAVRVIKISRDGCLVVCGGDDGLVTVWNSALILSNTSGEDSKVSAPMHSFSNHMLPVTDLCFTSGAFKLRVTSVSEDRTAKVYDVESGNMLLSVIFDAGLCCVAIPNTDTGMYIGQQNGTITEMKFSKILGVRKCHHTDVAEHSDNYIGHEQAVTSLVLTMDCVYLISGSNDGTIRIWDTTAHHCLRTIVEKGPVNCLLIAYLPYTAFQNTFKPRYNFQQNNINENTENSTFEVNTSIKPLPFTLPCLRQDLIENDRNQVLINTNKSLYAFILKHMTDKIVKKYKKSL